jgi:hypothetical protein
MKIIFKTEEKEFDPIAEAVKNAKAEYDKAKAMAKAAAKENSPLRRKLREKLTNLAQKI